MKKNFNKFHALLCILVVTVLVFRQFFLTELYPIPANFMLAWFEPWKTEHSNQEIITLVHKPIADDIFRQLYPFKVLAMDLLKHGELPLWNPYNGAGQPLLATMHAGILNPLNVLFFLFDDPAAWTFQVILSVFGIGLTTFLFCRKIGVSYYGSLFAAVAFMLSGFTITRSLYTDYNFAVLCLPLLLYLLEDLWNNKQSKKILFLPAVIFFMCTVVQPQLIFYILSLTLAYVIFHYVQISHIRVERKEILTLFLLTTVGIGLASVQLFPTFELFQLANVSSTSSAFIIDRFLLPASHFVSLFIPNYFGNQATYNYWGAGDYIESMVSLGTIPLFLALLGVVKKSGKKRIGLFFFSAGIIAIFLSIRSPITQALYSIQIPIVSTSVPSRILFIPVFYFSILAGFGIDLLLEQKLKLKNLAKITMPYLLFLLLICAVTVYLLVQNVPCTNEVISNCRNIAFRNTLLELGTFTCFFFMFSGYFFLHNQMIKRVFFVGLLCIVIAIGLYNSTKLLPFSEKKNIMPSHPLIDKVKEQTGVDRVFGFGEANIKTNFATHYGFYDPNYYDPLYNKRYGELVGYANTGKLLDKLPRSDIEIANDIELTDEGNRRRVRLLSLLGVKYHIFKTNSLPSRYEDSPLTLWGNKDWTITINSAASPRARLYYNYEVISNQKKLLKKVYTTDLGHVLLLEEKPRLVSKKPFSYAQFRDVEFTGYTPNKVRINAQTDEPAILFLSDNYFPGWKAYVNGKEVKILRANYSFRAVELPPGKHKVLFSYEPSSLRLGAGLSLFFALLYFGLFLLWPKISGQKNV